jgi:hypothetical protein
MIYIGTWGRAEFDAAAEDGDGQALFRRMVSDPPPSDWVEWLGERAGDHGITVYVFRSRDGAQLAAHYDWIDARPRRVVQGPKQARSESTAVMHVGELSGIATSAHGASSATHNISVSHRRRHSSPSAPAIAPASDRGFSHSSNRLSIGSHASARSQYTSVVSTTISSALLPHARIAGK